MPTPNLGVLQIAEGSSRPSRPHVACPDETSSAITTATAWQQQPGITGLHQDTDTDAPSPCPSEDPMSPAAGSGSDDEKARVPATPTSLVEERTATPDKETQSVPSPAVSQKVFTRRASSISAALDLPSTNYDTPTKRLLPSYSSSFLRPGTKFVGKQTSDRSTYEVHVELKHVNMADSFLCGYLRIKGLTEDHPTLTTYFEGEMIGDKYTFQTPRREWGSTERNDLLHWSKFPAFRPLVSKQQKRTYTNFAQKENIFMRWKEYFLVPDHRVRQISGASFDGFYYICFNQVSGTVDGIYFHAKSEKFQKLQLKYLPEKTFACVEFR